MIKAITILETSMVAPTPGKRKTPDDDNPLNAVIKKRREASTKGHASNQLKLLNGGDEEPGSLVMLRAGSSTDKTSSQEPPSIQPPSRSRSLSVSSQAQGPPLKRFKSLASVPSSSNHKPLAPSQSIRDEKEAEEDVRRMKSEADQLRRKSRAAEDTAGFVDPPFPLQAAGTSRRTTPGYTDTTRSVNVHETPKHNRNKALREVNGRRSSTGSRGKRVSTSYEATGIIAKPHSSVSDLTLYKHIDPEVSESQRARQLLVWSAHRASSTSASSSTSSAQQGKDPPPKLNSEGVKILRQVQEHTIKMLVDKLVDTSVYGDDAGASSSAQLRANEQNVMNREREERFLARIERAKAEDQAWVEVSQFYNSYKENSESALKRQPLSAKSKGKQRATDSEMWATIGRELPLQFQGQKGVDMALRLLEEASTSAGSSTKVKERLADVELKLDGLHERSRAALKCTRTVEDELDRRFADLNIAITSTNVLPPIPNDTLPPRLLNIPHGSNPHPITTDPQDVLRALSRLDMQRPPTQVGDSARRAAREAQRANESSNIERKLTGIPNTPRKTPGTPRRPGTPGRR